MKLPDIFGTREWARDVGAQLARADEDIRAIAALANAVLALYGEPEPAGPTPMKDVNDKLNELAAIRRTRLSIGGR